jgi:hypothetical protein
MSINAPLQFRECPFCGGEPRVEILPSGFVEVSCEGTDEDGCYILPSMTFDTLNSAAEGWNERYEPKDGITNDN